MDAVSSQQHHTILNIVRAHNALRSGHLDRAEAFRNQAKEHLDNHVKLWSHGADEEKINFPKEMAPYFEKLDSLISEAKNKTEINQAPKKSFFSKLFGKNDQDHLEESLEKITPANFNSNININDKVKVDRQPGKDSRYNYKPFNELKHEDQIRATHAFQNKNMTGHHYPVDKETGSFVHGATRWLQPKSAPQATPADQKVLIDPEHRVGASVRINAEGSPHHGKLGVVKLPSPYFKGKIAVQVGIKDHQTEYFEPSQVKLNKSEDFKIILEDLVNRGHEALIKIKKES